MSDTDPGEALLRDPWDDSDCVGDDTYDSIKEWSDEDYPRDGEDFDWSGILREDSKGGEEE